MSRSAKRLEYGIIRIADTRVLGMRNGLFPIRVVVEDVDSILDLTGGRVTEDGHEVLAFIAAERGEANRNKTGHTTPERLTSGGWWRTINTNDDVTDSVRNYTEVFITKCTTGI